MTYISDHDLTINLKVKIKHSYLTTYYAVGSFSVIVTFNSAPEVKVTVTEDSLTLTSRPSLAESFG